MPPLVSLFGAAVEADTPAERERALQRLGDVSLFIAGFFAHGFARRLVDIDYHIAMGGRAYGTLAETLARGRRQRARAGLRASCRRSSSRWSTRSARSATARASIRRPMCCACTRSGCAPAARGRAACLRSSGIAAAPVALQLALAVAHDRAPAPAAACRHLRCAAGLRRGAIPADRSQRAAAEAFRASSTDEQLLVAEGDAELSLGLFLAPEVLERLDAANPLEQLDGANLADYWTALEGVSHFVYLAWNAGHDRPVSLHELELQAEVDKYAASALLLRAQDPRALSGRAASRAVRARPRQRGAGRRARGTVPARQPVCGTLLPSPVALALAGGRTGAGRRRR